MLDVELVLDDQDAESSWHACACFLDCISLQVLSREFVEQLDGGIDVTTVAVGLEAFFVITITAASSAAALTSDFLAGE